MNEDFVVRCHFALYVLIDRASLPEAAAEIAELKRMADSDESLRARADSLASFWSMCFAATKEEWEARWSREPLPRAHSAVEYERITHQLIDSLVERDDDLCEECRLEAARAIARRQADVAVESSKEADRAR